MEIRFCDECDSSIPQADLERGDARRRGGRTLCAECRRVLRRRKATRYVLFPAAFLAAAALGALVAVEVTSPRLSRLRSEVIDLRETVRALPPPDTGLTDELRGLRELMRENVATQEGVQTALEEAQAAAVRELSAAVTAVSDQIGLLATEIRSIKERLAQEVGAAEAAEIDVPAPEGPPALEVHLALLESDDPGVRFSALLAIEGSDDPRVNPRILALLSDGNPDVRSEAARIVGEREVELAITPLIELLLDEELLVRDEAARALRALGAGERGFSATDPETARMKAVQAFRAWDREREK